MSHVLVIGGLTWACGQNSETLNIGKMLDVEIIGQVPNWSALHSSWLSIDTLACHVAGVDGRWVRREVGISPSEV